MAQTLERRKQYDRERFKASMADPARHAAMLERKRKTRKSRALRNTTIPPGVNADTYRAHGPWAPLFALAAAA